MDDFVDYSAAPTTLGGDYSSGSTIVQPKAPVTSEATEESVRNAYNKRVYEWSSLVKTVAVVDAPKKYGAYAKPYSSAPSQPSGTVEKEYQKPPMAMTWIPDDVEPTKESLLAALVVTEEERAYIWSIDQREDAWHVARRGRLTGSRVGSAAGHNKFESPKKLINNWLYVSIDDNFNMKWGRDHESEAREQYRQLRIAQFAKGKFTIPFDDPPEYLPEKYRTITDVVPVDPNTVSDKPYDMRIEVRGLIVHPTINWFGYSADGEVFETDDKGLLEIKCPQRLHGHIIHSYYDQVQYEGQFQ